MKFLLVALVTAVTLAWTCAPLRAQAAKPVFRIEEDADAPGSKRAVSGWVYNDGTGVVGLVRLKLEVLDESNQVIGEERGWVYGNVRPGGRAYFRIALPKPGPGRRITVESWVLQALESP